MRIEVGEKIRVRFPDRKTPVDYLVVHAFMNRPLVKTKNNQPVTKHCTLNPIRQWGRKRDYLELTIIEK